MFNKAERRKAKLRLGLSGSSGSGKTYSSLLLAYGLCGSWERIALIDTERRSGELYSHLGGYSTCQLDAPFHPKKYIDAILEAEKMGFEVIIIDSLSHAWNADGGMLDLVDKISASSKSGNSFTAWRDVTPLHNQLIDTILRSNCHIIVNTRAKTEYVMEDINGKKTPKKIGLAPVFRDGLEFEMTAFFDIASNHYANVSKDRTGIFDGEPPFIPTVDTGKKFLKWLNAGVEEKPMTLDEARAITTSKGTPLHTLDTEQLAEVIAKVKDHRIVEAAKILRTSMVG